MTESLDLLIDAVRDACNSTQWARGVQLQRGGAVTFEARGEGTITLRVAARRGLVAPAVTLAPGDPSWSCECDARGEACEHVAAAALALREDSALTQATEGESVTTIAPTEGRIAYRLGVAPAGLTFTRVALSAAGELPIAAPLEAIATGRADGPRFVAAPLDLEIERAGGLLPAGAVVPRERVERLFRALSSSREVTLEGEPVRVSIERIPPVALVRDRGAGFWVELTEDPRVTRSFAAGVLLLGERLALRGEAPLNARERDELTAGRYWPPERAGEMVAEWLPILAAKLPLWIDTIRLPQSATLPPRLLVRTARDNDALLVSAELVYGDPVRARIEDGRMVLLGGGAVPQRDPAAEARLLKELEASLRLSPGGSLRFDGEAAIGFAAQLSRWSGEVDGDAHHEFRDDGALMVALQFDAQFEATFRTSAGARPRGGAAAVLRAWQSGQRWVGLESGGFASLPNDWLTRHGVAVADLMAARDASGTLTAAALPELARFAEQTGAPVPNVCRLHVDRLKAALEQPAELPSDLCATLRHYQHEGVTWLRALGDCGLGALLADDMGLGKTVQTLAALQGRTLVVAPASVVFNWSEECGKFRPGLCVATYHGANRRLDPAADVTITTYALLRLDLPALAAVAWDTVVLDEANAIKNPESQAARATLQLRAGRRIALSGTPVENRLTELWSVMQFLNPGWLGSLDDFSDRIERPIATGDSVVAMRLRQRLQPFVLRRLKREVAPELPPRTELVRRCELADGERATYDALQLAARTDVVEQLQSGGNPLHALEALLRLRQACCHAALVPGSGVLAAAGSSKLSLLLELLDTAAADGHKSLVFTQWTSLLDLAEPWLQRAGLPYTRLDGSTQNRGAVVAEFQREDGPPVMLLSLKAGGVGLNLTAADHVFLLDPWWNPAAEDQAADRAHRIGQEKPVFITRLIAAGTVEERVLALQESKRAVAAAALGTGGALAALSRDEVLSLLGA